MKVMDRDSEYDGGMTPAALEYPLSLTFHRLLCFMNDPNHIRFGKYTEKEILILMEHALETCYQIMNIYDTRNEESLQRLQVFFQEVDDKHSVMYEWHHRDRVCHRLSLWLGSKFDEFVTMLEESGQYVYMRPIDRYLRDTESEESESEEDDKKEC